jgi:hypothetical protein
VTSIAFRVGHFDKLRQTEYQTGMSGTNTPRASIRKCFMALIGSVVCLCKSIKVADNNKDIYATEHSTAKKVF